MNKASLAVSLYGERVGTLIRRPGGGTFFHPEQTWVSRSFKPRLGLAWDLHPELKGQRSFPMYLPPWFENLLPERDSTLRQRIASALRVSSERSFDLLSELGHDLPGAVIVQSDTSSISSTNASVAESESTAIPESAQETDELHGFSSLGGMQLKFSVSVRNGKVVLPLKGQDGDWLIKLTTGDYPQLSQVEHATMQWAKRVGFDVPEHRLVKIAEVKPYAHLASDHDEWGFLIRRFDRSPQGRIHQEDFAQVLEIMPEKKYAERNSVQINHHGMAKIILDACGENELRSYLERLVFVLVSGNTDAHFKNWSLLHPREGFPRLTPLYDQVCTISWKRFGWENTQPRLPQLALGLGGTRWFSEIDVHSFHPMARRVGMREEQMAKLVQEAVERCLAAWPHIEPIAPARMREALARHTCSVPLLRRFKSTIYRY